MFYFYPSIFMFLIQLLAATRKKDGFSHLLKCSVKYVML